MYAGGNRRFSGVVKHMGVRAVVSRTDRQLCKWMVRIVDERNPLITNGSKTFLKRLGVSNSFPSFQ